jgi:hypothetical protein
MNSEDWYGLTVRTREGTLLGVVVGVFAEGLLAGRLRVQGDYACTRLPSRTAGRLRHLRHPTIGHAAQGPGHPRTRRDAGPSAGRLADACAAGEAGVMDTGESTGAAHATDFHKSFTRPSRHFHTGPVKLARRQGPMGSKR